MIAIDKTEVENIIKAERKKLDEHHKKAYSKLQNLRLKNCLSHKESHFLRHILRMFSKYNLVTISIEDILKLKTEIGEMPKTTKRKFAGKTSKTYLKDEILKALDYEGKRGSYYPEYFNKLGIKACVYCNSQLTLSVKKNKIGKGKNEFIAKFQVDHYFPKAIYPYLSISLFNLYPVCASCNNIKGDDDVYFQLYQDKKEIQTDLMGFELDQSQKAKFLISKDSEDISFSFYNKDFKEYDEKFHITEIYNTQKDIAEEIIIKALEYDKYLRKQLKGFGNIDDALIDRIILGNYVDPHEIHKRPMAKFMQDIAREAGLDIHKKL